MSDFTNPLRARLEKARADRRRIVDTAKAEQRDALNYEEDADFRALTETIDKCTERLADLAEQEQRSARVGSLYRGDTRTGSVYGPESRSSYFGDLIAAHRGGDYEAQQRLNLYASESRDLNRTDGSGGFFVPPAWLVDEFVGLPRPGRVTADLLTRRPLPGGTDSINVPKIVTGTATALQPADNDPVQETDLTDTTLTAPVRTIAGQQDIAIQLLDQSPVNFDEIIFRDLAADFATKLNAQVLSGSGTAGQLLGLRNVVGADTVTWTSAAPTVAELVKKVADATSRITSSTYRFPTAIVMHPRRWAWLTSQTDSNGRPFVVPTGAGPNNAPGLVGGAAAEGRVGELNGLPVYVDGGLPTNLGAGTNQDPILVADFSDTYLYESGIRTRVLPEVLSGTLTTRLQLFGYAALATRNAKSVVQIVGTGTVTPVFA